MSGSTDMANVSLAIPTIHPMLGLGSFPISNHQPEFAAFCATEAADKAMLDGAIAMAWTCIDVAADEPLKKRLLSRPPRASYAAEGTRQGAGPARRRARRAARGR